VSVSSSTSVLIGVPQSASAMTTRLITFCDGICTDEDIENTEKLVAQFLGIPLADVKIVIISQLDASAVVELTVCADDDDIERLLQAIELGQFSEFSVTDVEGVVILDPRFFQSCPIGLELLSKSALFSSTIVFTSLYSSGSSQLYVMSPIIMALVTLCLI
jgi:hypothetical protein